MYMNRTRKLCSVLCLGSSLTAACHEHVALQAPTSEAPEAARVEAYSKLRPLSYHETTTWMAGDLLGTTTERHVDYLQLAGGQRLYYPEDILDVVPLDSPAARAASDSRSNRQLGNGLQLGGAAALTAGIALALFSLFTVDASGNVNTTPLYFGLGITGVGLGLFTAAHFVGNSAADDASTAFETYEPSLRKQLDLCLEDEQVHDCR